MIYVKIEKAKVEELEKYYEVFEKSSLYDRYFDGTDMLKKWLDAPVANGNAFVAKTNDGDVAGVMVMLVRGAFEMPYLALLGVKRRYRSQGIGRKLLQLFIDTSEEIGAPNMFIMTSIFNYRSKQIYESLGFQKVGIIPDYMIKGTDEYLMMRPNMRLRFKR